MWAVVEHVGVAVVAAGLAVLAVSLFGWPTWLLVPLAGLVAVVVAVVAAVAVSRFDGRDDGGWS